MITRKGTGSELVKESDVVSVLLKELLVCMSNKDVMSVIEG